MLVLVVLGVTQRLVLEKAGRHVNTVNLDDPETVLQPPRVRALRDAGKLTVLTGGEVYNVFRSQFPINPHISTQENLVKLDTDKTYLITDRRKIFERLRQQLPGSAPYESENLVFNGVRVPNNFVLETDRSKEELLDHPLNLIDSSLRPGPDQYLYLAGVDARRVLTEDLPDTFAGNVIIDEPDLLRDHDLTRSLMEGGGSIYLLGRNAVMAGPETHLGERRLVLTEGTKRSSWFDGSATPPGVSFFAVALTLLVAAVGFLGIFLQGYPLRWALWLVVGILAYLLLDGWHLVLTGLVAAGVARLGFRLRGPSTGWFLLAGLIVYGFGYRPYLFEPFGSTLTFWGGALVGFLCVTEDWRRRMEHRLRYADLVLVGLALGAVWLAGPVVESTVNLGSLMAYTAVLPLVPAIFAGGNGDFSLAWVAGLAAWSVVFLAGSATAALFYFLPVMVAWFLFRAIGRRGLLWGRGFRA